MASKSAMLTTEDGDNAMGSLISVQGIVIGVAAVILMVSIWEEQRF
jgi:hypothetical protein